MVSGILVRIGIGVIAATVLAAIVGYFLPSTFEVEETQVIKATPERIHQFTGDLVKWTEWMPWLKDDPDLEIVFSEETSGPGATLSWSGGSGEGHLEVTRNDPAWGVSYDLYFSKNSYTSTRSLTYRAVPEGTEVVWHLSGDNGNNLMARYFVGLMPSFIGPQFEEGLARLKLLAERATIESGAVPEG